MAETVGGGIKLEQQEASPERVLGIVRRILIDQRLRDMMGVQMRQLHLSDAASRLRDTIVDVARASTGRRLG
jgi:hypothetical protein